MLVLLILNRSIDIHGLLVSLRHLVKQLAQLFLQTCYFGWVLGNGNLVGQIKSKFLLLVIAELVDDVLHFLGGILGDFNQLVLQLAVLVNKL